jgi:hypothetical protein
MQNNTIKIRVWKFHHIWCVKRTLVMTEAWVAGQRIQ